MILFSNVRDGDVPPLVAHCAAGREHFPARYRVWIPHVGVVGGEVRRWLSLGFTTFQLPEIAKIAVVLLSI